MIKAAFALHGRHRTGPGCILNSCLSPHAGLADMRPLLVMPLRYGERTELHRLGHPGAYSTPRFWKRTRASYLRNLLSGAAGGLKGPVLLAGGGPGGVLDGKSRGVGCKLLSLGRCIGQLSIHCSSMDAQRYSWSAGVAGRPVY
jgi:hypothetical protein